MLKINKEDIILKINQSIKNASNNISLLNEEILNLQGFSGKQTRHLYNNICGIGENLTYLEVGTYRGSTLISSLFKNSIKGIAIDDWSQFDGSYEYLKDILIRYNLMDVTLIQKDCFSITDKEIPNNSIDIYLYDGEHSYDSQFKAITCFFDFLSPLSIIMVDDYCWDNVNRGTMDGFKAISSKLNIVDRWSLESDQSRGGDATFWNGCGIFLCEKI
jgi:hypothetical protein